MAHDHMISITDFSRIDNHGSAIQKRAHGSRSILPTISRIIPESERIRLSFHYVSRAYFGYASSPGKIKWAVGQIYIFALILIKILT
uniref:Uncharacterized protein n=1 Tax=uncultured Desulfobacterium sp. TaxID=201089 RepID=E1YAF4_9BACT|nr:unknown protein [uncultured Desulfobacterium sp.]